MLYLPASPIFTKSHQVHSGFGYLPHVREILWGTFAPLVLHSFTPDPRAASEGGYQSLHTDSSIDVQVSEPIEEAQMQ